MSCPLNLVININLVINTVKDREVSDYGFIVAEQAIESSTGGFLLKTQ